MLQALVVGVVQWCWRHALSVVALSVVLTGLLGWYASGHLGLDTDESKLVSADAPFRKAEEAFDGTFPQSTNQLVVVIDAPTTELAEDAVTRLAERLAPRKDVFRSVRRPSEEMFFRQHGLLFLSPEDLTEMSDRLTAAQPMLGSVARDPSLRGLLGSVNLALEGASRGQVNLNDMTPLLTSMATTADAVATGKVVKPVSWQALFGGMADRDQPRRFLLTQPVLQYDELESGGVATELVRKAAADLGLTDANGVRVRLTGSVALSDANFATVTEGVKVSTPIMLLAVCGLLYLAVRSIPVVLAILFSLVVGLVATAAFAAATVGTLNPISVAFAVMFVGIAVDFAIQFVVRFRDERYRSGTAEEAIRACSHYMAAPLSLAAATTAVGFLSFLPTAYTGVSQLGLIAGGGMVIALVIDFTLLPALLSLVRPHAEKEPVGLPLAAADGWLVRHDRAVVGVAGVLALVGLGMLPFLPLDFNPLKLQSPKAEAVSTLFELARDPDNGVYAVEFLAADRKAADALADRLSALPEVKRAMTIGTFVPEGQDEKMAIISDMAGLLGPTLSPPVVLPKPSLDDLRTVLLATADKLESVANLPDVAKPLSAQLRQIAKDGGDAPERFQRALVAGLPAQLETLRHVLAVQPIAYEALPPALVRDWVGDKGQVRVEAVPKEDLNDHAALLHFTRRMLDISPAATGMPVSMVQSGDVVVGAFTRAGLGALAAIGLLLWLMVRRVLDAVLVVLPLLAGALYTAIGCVLFGLSINFANIIALPLLLGIGVAFNIYYVVNWRNGVTDHLQSATTRAVLFSALTTGTAFGSLAVSPHLGTASMGLLLFLSLGLSVVTTFVVLPALFSVLRRKDQ